MSSTLMAITLSITAFWNLNQYCWVYTKLSFGRPYTKGLCSCLKHTVLEDLKGRVATVTLNSLPSHSPYPNGTLSPVKILGPKKKLLPLHCLPYGSAYGSAEQWWWQPGDWPTDTFCLEGLRSWLTVCCLYRYVVRRHWRKWNMNQNMANRKQQVEAPRQNAAKKSSPGRETGDRAICKRETAGESHIVCTPFM